VRRNPLLMTVMGNPRTGPRTQKTAERALDQAISHAWAQLMSGVQVPIMDIPRIFRDIKLEIAGGSDLQTAVQVVGGRYRVNRNPCHGGGYRANPFILIDSATNKIIRTWRGSMTDRKPFDWARDAARRLGRSVFIVAHPYVPPTFRAGVEVSPLFYFGGPYQMVHPDGTMGRGPEGGIKRNPGFAPAIAGSIAGSLVAHAMSNPGRSRARMCEHGRVDRRRCTGCRTRKHPRELTAMCPHGVSGGRRCRSCTPFKANGARKVTMPIEKFAKLVKARNDPALWRDFVAKCKAYHKWSHGTWPKKATIEAINKPGMKGIWISFDMGREPEKTYVMPKGTKRKGAWKHPWERMPQLRGDAEAGFILTKLGKGNRLTDFLHGN
jgi:hypothetical protein